MAFKAGHKAVGPSAGRGPRVNAAEGKWTDAELKKLGELTAERVPIKAIAAELGRTENAVREKKRLLGLTTVVRRDADLVTPETTFLRYLAMGTGRSLTALHHQLVEEGFEVSWSTIRKWSVMNQWQEQAESFDADERRATRALLMEETAKVNARQARMGLAMQLVATRRIDNADEMEMSASDIARWARVGVDIERLAIGEATSRPELMYNQVIAPVLMLFQQVTAILPLEQREAVTQAFADGVNAIRDRVVPTEVVDDDDD